jgi:hypothetical protein
MYEKLEGGTVIDIQGLPCCIPPEGYVHNIITKKLEWRGVYERSAIQEEQYWERIPLPDWYKEVTKAWDDYDKKKKDDESEFYDERLEEYKRQEWDRRLNGFWYRNNGKAVYLAGMHYLYLQWWPIDIGYPKFRMPDLEKAYFLSYCIEDPLCMGMVEVTKRRFGKSFWAGLFVTEYTTRTKMTNGGIQSKTGNDAKKFFSKTVVNPFRRLPKFFRPEYDMSLGVNPKSEMRFQKTNVRGKKAEENVDRDELGSVIDWGSAEKVFYDGQKLHRYVADECGKTTEVDVYERHEVVRYCLLDDEGKIIGKALYTTTVEKLDSDKSGVQDAFRLLWNESNQNDKKANGMTASGLYRFFMSAKKTRNFDLYGYPDEIKTEKAILDDREGVKGNPRALFARIRKEPLTIDEAFSIDADQCIFNADNIAKREKELQENPVFKRKVWFYRDELSQTVKWRDITAREKDFHWEITQFPPQGSENKFIMDGSVRKPGRSEDGAIAIDGYSNSQGGQKWGSRASAWIGRRYDLFNPESTGKAIGHIYGRPLEKESLHDQVLLAAEYYGYPAYYEHNSDDYDSYFKARGRRAYLGLYPLIAIKPEERQDVVRHRGVPTTPFSLTKQTDLGLSYFENYCHQIDWQCLLDDAKNFDPNDRTKSDITVSFLILLLTLNEQIIKPPPPSAPLIKTYPAIANSQNN